ncbi:hypothetical protein U1Q18_026583 [Sarracenia purpurea var. burkii]
MEVVLYICVFVILFYDEDRGLSFLSCNALRADASLGCLCFVSTAAGGGLSGAKLAAQSIKSNFIDKLPPIESISWTLFWDDSCAETATSNPPKPSLASQGLKEEDVEWFFVQALLLVVGIGGRWYSPENPLDPSLGNK